MSNIFTKHPNSVNETYWQHLKFAISCGVKMLFAGLVSIIHGIFPFLFQTTGSTIILNLAKNFSSRTPNDAQ